MSVVFSMGKGHGGAKPDAANVLDSLASDAAGFENSRSFEEWCGEYGYDTDSRRAERMYNAVKKQAASLKRFLGPNLHEALLYKTDAM